MGRGRRQRPGDEKEAQEEPNPLLGVLTSLVSLSFPAPAGGAPPVHQIRGAAGAGLGQGVQGQRVDGVMQKVDGAQQEGRQRVDGAGQQVEGVGGPCVQGKKLPRVMPRAEPEGEAAFQERLVVVLALVNRVLRSLHKQVAPKGIMGVPEMAALQGKGVGLTIAQLPVQGMGAAAPDAVRLAYELLLALYHLASHGCQGI